MSRGVEVVVVMKNSKIDEMFITNQRGNRIGYLDKDNFFPEMVTRNQEKDCVIYEDDKNLIFAESHCDLIKLDAYLWSEGK